MTRRRRWFLSKLGAGSFGALAGCAALTDDEPTDGTAAPTDAGTDVETTTGVEDGEEGTDGTDREDEQDVDDAGTVSGEAPDVIEIAAGGEDIWNDADEGFIYYEERSGDFDVRVRAISLEERHSWAKAGIMIRESTDADAPYVFVMRRPDGQVTTQFRTEAGAGAQGAYFHGDPLGTLEMEDPPEPSWDWLRLERAGDTVRTYVSPDGEEWTEQTAFTDEIAFSDRVVVGLAVTGHDDTEPTTAHFGSLDGLEPDAAENLGAPSVDGDVRTIRPAIFGSIEPVMGETSLTLDAEVLLGDEAAATVRFAHRQVPDADWIESDRIAVGENRVLSYDVTGLEARRLYQYRATIDDGETALETGVRSVATDAPSASDSDGPRSAAQHDPSDGFVEVAPWLDDRTPIVPITEPDRAQLERAGNVDHPRVIVFETSGVIDLEEGEFRIDRDDCWVAGQTAPSPGITFVRGSIRIDADDCTLQHVRSRPGDAGRTGEWQNDAIEIAAGTDGNVVDHCSATWAIDEQLSIGYPGTGKNTVSNCLIAEALHESLHPEGRHGYGSIASPEDSDETAHLGNVWALNSARNPRTGPKAFYANCLSYAFERAARLDEDAENAFVGHAFVEPVDDTKGCIQNGYVYTDDCVTEPEDVPLTANLQGELDEPPLVPEDFEALAGDRTEAAVLEHCGARPADRTEIDERILRHVRDRDGRYIDSQEEVGGYPELEENTRESKIPDEGLRAWLREKAREVEP